MTELNGSSTPQSSPIEIDPSGRKKLSLLALKALNQALIAVGSLTLNETEREIIDGILNGDPYKIIAKQSQRRGHSHSNTQNIAAELWKRLGKAMGYPNQLKQRNFLGMLEQFMASVPPQTRADPPINQPIEQPTDLQPIESPLTQPIAQDPQRLDQLVIHPPIYPTAQASATTATTHSPQSAPNPGIPDPESVEQLVALLDAQPLGRVPLQSSLEPDLDSWLLTQVCEMIDVYCQRTRISKKLWLSQGLAWLRTNQSALALSPYPQPRHAAPSYAAGNLLTLSAYLNIDISGQDFSGLEIRQVDLRQIDLYNVNFSGATFIDVSFADALGQDTKVIFSPDSTCLIYADETGQIVRWHIADNKPLAILPLRGDPLVHALAMSRDQQMLAVAIPGEVRIWHDIDAQRLPVLYPLPAGWQAISKLAFSPDMNYLACGSESGQVTLLRLQVGRFEPLPIALPEQINLSEPINSLSFSATGQQLVIAYDSCAVLWEFGTQTTTAIEHSGGTCRMAAATFAQSSLAQKPATEAIAIEIDDKILAIRFVSAAQSYGPTLKHDTYIQKLALSDDGNCLVSLDQNHRLRQWDLTHPAPTALGNTTIPLSETAQVTQLALSPNHRFCAIVTPTCLILWNLQAGQADRYWVARTHRLHQFNLCPQANYLVTRHLDGLTYAWDLPQNKRFTLSPDPELPMANRTERLALSPCGQYLATGDHSGRIDIWQLATGEQIETWQDSTHPIVALDFSADGQKLIGLDREHQLWIWAMPQGEMQQQEDLDATSIHALAVSPSSEYLAIAGAQMLQICRANRNPVWHNLDSTTTYTQLRFSPNSDHLASLNHRGIVQIWSVQSPQPHRVNQLEHYPVQDMCWTSHHQLAIVGYTQNQALHLWPNADEPTPIVLPTRAKALKSVRFCASGQYVLAQSGAGMVSIWHTQSGELWKEISTHLPYSAMDLRKSKGLDSLTQNRLKSLGARI